MTLDDAAAIRAADPGGILDAFLRLPQQLIAGHRAATDAGLGPFEPRSVAFCGMGGSAAGGDVAAAGFAGRLRVPVASARGYAPPPHCGPRDLVVCLSFSGGTEETLACYADAVERGSRVVAVCSGGPLADRARGDGAGLILVPADVPMPRSGLGYLAGAAAGSLAAMGILPDLRGEMEATAASLSALAEELAPDRTANEAMEVARAVGSHVPVVWGSEGGPAAAAFRWKAAFNENAKVPAFASRAPELLHHEVAGWSRDRGRGFLAVVLRDEDEHPAVGARVEAALRLVEESGLGWREVRARGATRFARVLSLTMMGDAASTYHAIARGVDPTPIEAIARLKNPTAKGGA